MIKLGLIGDPISHSLSPIIHSTVMDYLNIQYSYEPCNVKKGELEKYIQKVKDEDILGFNVTMPHKVDIINYLDELDNESLRYNSVNTVKYENGKLYGYNTDANGLLLPLYDNGIGLENKNILILGAGGVANTIAVKLAMQKPNRIVILNRTLEKAQNICELVRKTIDINISYNTLETVAEYTKTSDILINATPLGMHGVNEDFENLDFVSSLEKSSVVYDLIYNPRETKLLRHAKNLRLKTLNGLEMLIYQALIADQIYLDTKLDFKNLSRIVKEEL